VITNTGPIVPRPALAAMRSIESTTQGVIGNHRFSAESDGPGKAQQKRISVASCLSPANVARAQTNPSSRAKESNALSRRLEISPENKVKLREHIESIKDVLAATCRWELNGATDGFAVKDQQFMPLLVESANLSKSGFDLQYADTAIRGCELLKTAVEDGVSSGRYIVNLNADRHIHFCAVDYRLIGEIPSVISFEPVVARDLAWELEKQLSKIPNMHFLVVGMEIQSSENDCGMFSLAFAKKLHKEQDWMTALHEKNAAGELQLVRASYTNPEESDRFVPLSLYKHSQTRRRPAEYLERNPDKGNAVVNKKK